MVKKIVASCLFAWLFLIGTGFAQTYPHMAALRIESAELCPGQEADLAVYVDLFLGTPQGGTGCYTEHQKSPDPLDNFMFYLAISDTSKIEVVTSYNEDRGGYYTGRPVLTEMHPGLSGGSFTYNYIYGWDQLGNYGVKPEGAIFTCIWVKNGTTATFLPQNDKPLFRIRVRCKEPGEASLKFLPGTLAFSTGLTYMGGYYYTFSIDKNPLCNNISNAVITNGEGPRDVSAGRDSLICVRDRVVFNAEGGRSYKWKLLSNRTDYLSNHDTKNPTFFPLEPGTYTYQVQATDEQGCVSYARVNYLVSQNYINQVISPDDVMVDSGNRITFNLSASTLKPQGNVSSLKPMRLTLLPDSLFPPGGNVLYANSHQVSGQLTTLPITEPVLVTVRAQDTVCAAQKSANIHVRGVKVKGKIAPFPVYRCGNDMEDKRLQLNLVTTGGSGKFLYNWKVTDLEFGDLGDPWISNRTARAPMLWYVGRCALSVDIYDMETGETVTLSDTMIYRDWQYAQAEVMLDTVASGLEGAAEIGPFCETAELWYKVKSRYAGQDARYAWEVNGVWREEGVNDTVFSSVLRKGDSVSCVLYSTEACVAEAVVQSNRFAPEIRYPSMAEMVLGFETAPDYDSENCNGDISLAATLFSAGHNFRLQWLRNGELLVDERPYRDNMDSAVVVRHFTTGSYFDAYSCLLTESDMPCRAFDSIYSQSEDSVYQQLHDYDLHQCPPDGVTKNFLYPRQAPAGPVMAGEIEMVGEMAVCEGEIFTLRAKVENVPENFILKWLLKKGADSVLLGYYNYQGPTYDAFMYPQEPLPGNFNLRGSTGYGYSNCETGIMRAFSDGFKIVLNDPEAFVSERAPGYVKPGDTVYYVLYSTSEVCGRMPHAARSPYFVPQQTAIGVMQPPVIAYQEQREICPMASATLVASCPSDNFVSYEWFLYDVPVTDTPTEYYKYFTVSGDNNDTLFLHRVWPDFLIKCVATVNYGCNKGQTLKRYFKFDTIVKEASHMFGIERSMDTIICENAEVHLLAEVKEYDRPGKTEVKSTRAMRREKQKIAKNYTISWSINDLEALKNGGADVVVNSELRDTPRSNGKAPDGTGDWNDTKGLTVYYVKAEEKASGCEVYDSIWVLMAHPYQVKATIDYILPSPWCDSSFLFADADRKVEGQPYRPGGQYAVLNIENGGKNPEWMWGLNDEWIRNYKVDTLDMTGAPSGDTLKAWVKTDMYTCLPDTALAVPRLIQSTVGIDEMFMVGPDWASSGDRIMLVAEGGVLTDQAYESYDEVGNYDYTWSVQQSDGSWTELGQGSAAGRKQVDTFYTVMPAREAVFKVEAVDRYDACPSKSQVLKVALAVSTEVDLKAFDPVSGKEIEGFCTQSNALVLKDGEGKTGDISWVETDGRKSARVLLRAYPENAGGSAYVGYYKNGDLVAVGSVGTEAFRVEGTDVGNDFDYKELKYGDTVTMEIMPGDWVGAFYVNDTVSADGKRTHYSPRLTFNVLAPADGALQVTASRTAICAGMETELQAAFESGYRGDAPVWSPAASLSAGTGWEVIATPMEHTTYTAVAYDRAGCAWKDSLRVNIVTDGESLPLAILADVLRFCNEEAEVNLRIDERVSRAEDFTEFYWYAIEAGENRLVATTREASIKLNVMDGMQVFAQAKAVLTCQTGLSVSDTLRFERVYPPVLRRLQPLADTMVCPGSPVRVAYAVSPEDAEITWYSIFDNTVNLLEGETETWIEGEVPGDIVLRIQAGIPDLAHCIAQDEVAVKVFDADSILPQLTVEPEAEAICGERQIRYIAVCDRCDSLFWFANGREVLRNETTLLWTPRQTGLNGVADSIVVAGVRRASECVPALRVESAPVLVYRVDAPALRLLCGDTTVKESSPVLLAASATAFGGDAVSVYWYDGEYNTVSETATVELEMNKSDVFYALARQTELDDYILPECYSLDSVRIIVLSDTSDHPVRDTVFVDDVYVPNTIVPASSRVADRFLRVYGVDIKEVVMKVYDGRGIPVYESQGEPAQVYWNATDLNGSQVESGMYAYWVRVLTATGKIVEKRGWVNVVR